MVEQAGMNGLRVLLAEADEAGRRALRAMLEGLGCRCDLAGDGADAVERAASRAYDLVLVDVDLPVLNGAQCRQAIAGLPGRQGRAPVVALAPAEAGAARLARHRADGFAAVLPRPVDRGDLLACLRAQAAPAAEPAVDLAHLRRYTLGEAELERELLQAFLPSAAGYLAQLAAALEDAAQWGQAAHALKGAARGIGAFRLGDLAERAELDLADAGAGARRRLLADLGQALGEVESYVAGHLAGPG